MRLFLRALDLLDLSEDILKLFALGGGILHHPEGILQLVESLFKYGFALKVLHRGGIGQLSHRWRVETTHMRAVRTTVEQGRETPCCLVNYGLGLFPYTEALLSILVIKQVQVIHFQLWRTEISWFFKIVGLKQTIINLVELLITRGELRWRALSSAL
jgi:hypothetical protein